MKRITLNVGDKFKRWLITGERKEKDRYFYELLCDCGNIGKSEASHLLKGKTKSCGCLQKEGKWRIKHGLSNSREYKSWEMMIQRCTNEKYEGYDNYGGRGISYDPEWELFENFYKDMGERPKDTSLDRINPNLGYYKENCRWSKNQIQSFNKNLRKNNLSGRTGVSFNKKSKKYRSYINFKKERIELGLFNNFADAVKAREEAEMKYYGYIKNEGLCEVVDEETIS